MKKIVVSVVVFILLAGMCLSASAQEFDKTVLMESQYCEVDKFSGNWDFSGDYSTFTRTLFGMQLVFGSYELENNKGPGLWLYSYNLFSDEYDRLKAFRAVVDDKMFCFETLYFGSTHGWVEACPALKEFCIALQSAKEVAFQYDYRDGNYTYTSTIDPVNIEDLKEIIEAAKLIDASGAWTTVPDFENRDAEFEATVK